MKKWKNQFKRTMALLTIFAMLFSIMPTNAMANDDSSSEVTDGEPAVEESVDEVTDGEPTDGEPTDGEPTDGEPTDEVTDISKPAKVPAPIATNFLLRKDEELKKEESAKEIHISFKPCEGRVYDGTPLFPEYNFDFIVEEIDKEDWNSIKSIETLLKDHLCVNSNLNFKPYQIIDAGTYKIDVTPDGRAEILANFPDYNISVTEAEVEITPAPLTIKTDSAEKIYDGQPLSAGGKIEGLVNGETATIKTEEYTEVGKHKNVYEIEWDTAKASNYEITTKELGTITISEPTLDIEFKDGTFTYDGKPHQLKAEAKDEVTFTYVMTDSSGKEIELKEDDKWPVDAGEYTITVKATDKHQNSCEKTATLTIKPAVVTIKTTAQTKVYNGETFEDDYGCEILGVIEGDRLFNDINVADEQPLNNDVSIATFILNGGNKKDYITCAEEKDAGKYKIDLTADGKAALNKAMLEKVESDSLCNSNYELSFNTDVLVITSALLTITTGSSSKQYVEGEPLTNNNVKVEGLKGNDNITVSATGKQIGVGESDDGYTIDWGNVNKENYLVKAELGKLTVTKGPENPGDDNQPENPEDGNQPDYSGGGDYTEMPVSPVEPNAPADTTVSADTNAGAVVNEQEINDSDVPLAELPNEEVPLAAMPNEDHTVVVNDEEIPLSAMPEENLVDLADGEVPLADVPKTSDASAHWLLAALLSGAMLIGIFNSKKRKTDAE